MSIQSITGDSGADTISAPERETRIQLAAAYRLLHHFGITDTTHNHLTARVPDEPDAKEGELDSLFGRAVTSNMIRVPGIVSRHSSINSSVVASIQWASSRTKRTGFCLDNAMSSAVSARRVCRRSCCGSVSSGP